MILLDTHALLWWALDPERLSPSATQHCERMEAVGGYASSISLWEIGIKVKRGHLDLGITVEELARRIEQSAVVELLPVDVTTWLKSVELAWAHRDPADRVIVATALLGGLPLLTKDQVLHDFADVETIW